MDIPQQSARAPHVSGPILVIDDTILELLPAAVYVCDADGVIVRYNRKAAELWGRSPGRGDTDEKFCGAQRLFWPDGRSLPHRETPMAEVLRTGNPARNLEILIEQPGGGLVCALVNIEPIRNEAGEITGAINCFQDITARKVAEARLRRSQELLRAVVETTPDCVKIVARDGEILHMNPAGLAMVEADEAHAINGRRAFDLVAPEHREFWRCHHERVCDGESLSWEFDVVGLSGTRRHMETRAVPLRMPDDTVAQLAITRDVTQRKRFEETLRERERHYRELLEALPAAVYTTDAAGRITSYNQAAVTLWGLRPELGRSEWCGSWRLHWPDGTPMRHCECPMAIALKEDRPISGAEAAAERPDGTRVPFLAFPTPLHDASGALVGAVNMLVDISHRKQADEQQALLIRELHHRVKNTLATVQAIMGSTARASSTIDAFQHAFIGRIASLAKTHALLAEDRWQAVSFRDLLYTELDAYDDGSGSRIRLSGPAVELPSDLAVPVGMAIHELTTNAAKHGALSVLGGSVEVAWQLSSGPGARALRFDWIERDGPPVAASSHQGFGSRLLRRVLTTQIHADVTIDYRAEGLHAHVDLPLPSMVTPV